MDARRGYDVGTLLLATCLLLALAAGARAGAGRATRSRSRATSPRAVLTRPCAHPASSMIEFDVG
jgi:hypothetical protein